MKCVELHIECLRFHREIVGLHRDYAELFRECVGYYIGRLQLLLYQETPVLAASILVGVKHQMYAGPITKFGGVPGYLA